ncbi:hypothetical protein NEP95_16785 [Escherichia coli]|nr:hypothetical protein [Escherichia coli]EFO4017516.1 hypothetical protein [Escherichia coli]MCT6341662.1 hypothetical protein [Escherichia coli]MDI1110996.1 hypothetical protein [Escherichia coli]MDI1185877.1 hypothetical protein [Escherichia coli]
MKLYEMEGFLRGKCIPGDMKVNETNAEYLVRKFSEADSEITHLKKKLSVINSLMDAAEQANKLAQEATGKLVQERNQLASENAGLKSKAAELVHEASEVYSAYNSTITEPDGDFMDMQTLQEMQCVETPATDAFLAEVRASELDSLAGVAETMLVKFSNQLCSSDMHEVVGWKMVLQQASNRAAQLRKGVQS